MHRAQRAGMQPQQYYDQLVRSGAAGAVFGDVRRGKALASVMDRIKITDSAGNPVSLDELRARPTRNTTTRTSTDRGTHSGRHAGPPRGGRNPSRVRLG